MNIKIIINEDGKANVTGLLDWENAGCLPRQWISKRFYVSGGLCFDKDGEKGENEYEWPVRLRIEKRGFQPFWRWMVRMEPRSWGFKIADLYNFQICWMVRSSHQGIKYTRSNVRKASWGGVSPNSRKFIYKIPLFGGNATAQIEKPGSWGSGEIFCRFHLT